MKSPGDYYGLRRVLAKEVMIAGVVIADGGLLSIWAVEGMILVDRLRPYFSLSQLVFVLF